LVLIALNYWREYRTYAHLGVTYGYSESKICRIVCWCEDILINSGKFTVKGKRSLLSINPCDIVFGKTHDFKVLRDSKLPIKADTLVTTDSGYQGLQELHAKTELPKKKSKHKPLSKSDKKANYLLSVKRSFNEQVNGVVKLFKIIAEKFNLIAGIYNFELSKN